MQNINIYAVIFSFEANSRSCDGEKLEIPMKRESKVSVGKDSASKENCYWQQERHVTKNFIRQKRVNLNSDTLTFLKLKRQM